MAPIKLENWVFTSPHDGLLEITNIHAVQKTKLLSGLNGMEFESNKQELVQFTAKHALGQEFSAAPWLLSHAALPVTTATSTSAKLSALQHYLSAAANKSTRQKQKQLKHSVHKLAARLHDDYLKKCQSKPRSLALKLIGLVERMGEACRIDDASLYEQSLVALREVLAETTSKSISSYELSVSGLVPALLVALEDNAERRDVFGRVFGVSGESDGPLIALLRKLIALVESNERMPLFLYDAPGSYNLQAFSKRFKLVLSKGANAPNFLDFTGRTLKVEPLANVSHLEKYISKMVRLGFIFRF